MSRTANPVRGEASLRVNGETLLLRPTFDALVAAEEELGSLFALVEKAAEGQVKISEIVALFDHASRDGRPNAIDRQAIGAAVLALGLGGVMPALRLLLTEIMKGR